MGTPARLGHTRRAGVPNLQLKAFTPFATLPPFFESLTIAHLQHYQSEPDLPHSAGGWDRVD